MEVTVGHQLARAVAGPSVLPGTRVDVTQTAERIVQAVQRAYADKPVVAEVVPGSHKVRVDERDLMEMLGNLIENGFKYSRSHVRISCQDAGAGMVEALVDDDGDGIDPSVADAVLMRGYRADTLTPGQGIGLAVVVETATAYGGALVTETADLGGARLRLRLPG